MSMGESYWTADLLMNWGRDGHADYELDEED